ncbi:hypothetical protein V1291_005011 [Nitrobacteraceae bacterium AZCC 1564]
MARLHKPYPHMLQSLRALPLYRRVDAAHLPPCLPVAEKRPGCGWNACSLSLGPSGQSLTKRFRAKWPRFA